MNLNKCGKLYVNSNNSEYRSVFAKFLPIIYFYFHFMILSIFSFLCVLNAGANTAARLLYANQDERRYLIICIANKTAFVFNYTIYTFQK